MYGVKHLNDRLRHARFHKGIFSGGIVNASRFRLRYVDPAFVVKDERSGEEVKVCWSRASEVARRTPLTDRSDYAK